MKIIPSTIALILFSIFFSVRTTIQAQCGYYISKEDYLNKKITILERMQISENYNIGELKKLSAGKSKYKGTQK